MEPPSLEELSRRNAKLAGEVAVLGMAMQVALKFHPYRAEVAAEIHASYEQAIARVLGRPFPEAFLEGMKAALDLYVLKQ